MEDVLRYVCLRNDPFGNFRARSTTVLIPLRMRSCLNSLFAKTFCSGCSPLVGAKFFLRPVEI
jgi:hypothetical protein